MYEQELEAEIRRLQEELKAQKDQNSVVDQFIEAARTHVGIDKLDGYVLHEMMEAIYVVSAQQLWRC